jgi:hypothetical protein
VLIQLATDPMAWNTSAYATNEQRIRDHLGPELFFSKLELDRLTLAPEWDG